VRSALYACTRSKSYPLKAVIGDESGGDRTSGTGSEQEATSGDEGARVESNRHTGEREATSGDEGARVESESNRNMGERGTRGDVLRTDDIRAASHGSLYSPRAQSKGRGALST
jgi:hypothetical protein